MFPSHKKDRPRRRKHEILWYSPPGHKGFWRRLMSIRLFGGLDLGDVMLVVIILIGLLVFIDVL